MKNKTQQEIDNMARQLIYDAVAKWSNDLIFYCLLPDWNAADRHSVKLSMFNLALDLKDKAIEDEKQNTTGN